MLTFAPVPFPSVVSWDKVEYVLSMQNFKVLTPTDVELCNDIIFETFTIPVPKA